MEHPGFFHRAGPFSLVEIAGKIEADVGPYSPPELSIRDVRALSDAGCSDLSFIDNRKYIDALQRTRAGACIVAPALLGRVPAGVATLVAKAPYRSFALALQAFYPEALHSKGAIAAPSHFAGPVHPSAVIEEGAIIEPGAVIGEEAHIGRGTRVSAGAIIGYRVCIGRDGHVGAGASVLHALIGDRVFLHSGVRIGQDGFGFAMGPRGHIKVPQIGRVIIQDDVEVGANSTIDRGALKDTIIGEGTKIDNFVQIGHNAGVGRHCVIVGQVGISGSSVLGDFVMMGNQSGIVGHIRIGDGAHLVGMSHATHDVPAGARMAGTPSVPFRQYARSVAAMKKFMLARRFDTDKGEDGS